MPLELKRVLRLDSLPLNQTFFTPEGYLIDRPIVTSTGIFEYHNEDGSVRRELRLPEEVFSPKSLASYKGRPVIVTHDAGLINKDNVSENTIGTILSEGYRSGDDVRCEIVIHDTDEMKRCGYKELSLGYNLDLEETPGEWNGQHYDAIQRNIVVNHLALVQEARAGDQARLNIDSRDKYLPKGVKLMAKTKKTSRADSVLSPEEFNQAIEEYKARRAERVKAKKDAEEEKNLPMEEGTPVQNPDQNPVEESEIPAKEVEKDADDEEMTGETVPEKAQSVPAQTSQEAAAVTSSSEESEDKKMIAQMDEDMSKLFDIIDTLLAEREFNSQKPQEGAQTAGDECDDPINKLDKLKSDACGTSKKCDADDEVMMSGEEEDTEMIPGEQTEGETPEDMEEDESDVPEKEELKMNTDSVDKLIRERIQIGVVGEKLNLDGIDAMPVRKAKKAIIKAIRPGVRLDGKSDAYINAMFEMACAEAKTYKSVEYQKRQMFNKDKRMDSAQDKDSSENARQRMISRMNKNKED